MGCLRKVFRAEIDVEMFELAEDAGGFGGLKMTGEPLPQCQFSVEPAYAGSGEGFDCVNRRLHCSETGPEAYAPSTCATRCGRAATPGSGSRRRAPSRRRPPSLRRR